MKLKLISWNINMFNPEKPQLKNKIIKEINEQVTDEDIIILIESTFQFVNDLLKTDLKENYKSLNGFALSHGGFINILYNKNINPINIEKVEIPIENPTLLIRLVKENITTYIAGCHLSPYSENGQTRIEELLVVRTMVPEDQNLIMVGDMNIREKETKFLAENDNVLGVRDSGDKRKTWYNGFFDSNKMHITSRFDRLFISDRINVSKFELFGKKYINNKLELLSDHLAIKVELEVDN